ncbi:hypothetical protein SAMN05446037_1003119 [Anaerovirgula multivorans]|uniref:Uncharacterized protein n=1 Tax=Anaerovirgula multivorans TaxID=312168 RepID=A0A239B9R8_9FIRM|nr:hypothetical protein [Anaerovirgula multivorans]SNS04686.1 hypothetical protein SAMN05446037_1003119 [Anaerovirgula multivorans]
MRKNYMSFLVISTFTIMITIQHMMQTKDIIFQYREGFFALY